MKEKDLELCEQRLRQLNTENMKAKEDIEEAYKVLLDVGFAGSASN